MLDHVHVVFEWLRSTGNAPRSWLVTGNTRTGAARKLRHYGLLGFFEDAAGPGASPDIRGAFSTGVEPRAEIVRRAFQLAQAALPGLSAPEVLVIGDTPHDIEGARALDIPVLAVATNTHTLDELEAHRPWRALSKLPPPAEFAALLAAS